MKVAVQTAIRVHHLRSSTGMRATPRDLQTPSVATVDWNLAGGRAAVARRSPKGSGAAVACTFGGRPP